MRASLALFAVGSLIVGAPMSLASAAVQITDDSEPVRPFSAHYEASWKGINVGTSEIMLKKLPEPDQYLYTWTITARGIFRLAYSDDLVQNSWVSG